MRSAQYYPTAGDRTTQIVWESAIVVKAIVRHRREAMLQGRNEETHEMEVLGLGVSRMAHKLTRSRQQPYVA
jgi:hypothetical protein